MKHLVLVGDSIFDNASYVGNNESVTDILSSIIGSESKVTLLAVDGDVTTDVRSQLNKYPESATHLFISCGGNDALRQIDVLNKSVSSVGEAIEIILKIVEIFRCNYQAMLEIVLKKNTNVALCTVYNSIPDISERALCVLALFNEIILFEAISNKLPVIDLRVLCCEAGDYSEISPIEPSGQGGVKIANKIKHLVECHNYRVPESRVYA